MSSHLMRARYALRRKVEKVFFLVFFFYAQILHRYQLPVNGYYTTSILEIIVYYFITTICTVLYCWLVSPYKSRTVVENNNSTQHYTGERIERTTEEKSWAINRKIAKSRTWCKNKLKIKVLDPIGVLYYFQYGLCAILLLRLIVYCAVASLHKPFAGIRMVNLHSYRVIETNNIQTRYLTRITANTKPKLRRHYWINLQGIFKSRFSLKLYERETTNTLYGQ